MKAQIRSNQPSQNENDGDKENESVGTEELQSPNFEKKNLVEVVFEGIDADEKRKKDLRAKKENEEYERIREEKQKERTRLEAVAESRKRLKEQLMRMYLFDCEKNGLTPAANSEPLYDMVNRISIEMTH